MDEFIRARFEEELRRSGRQRRLAALALNVLLWGLSLALLGLTVASMLAGGTK